MIKNGNVVPMSYQLADKVDVTLSTEKIGTCHTDKKNVGKMEH